MRRLCLIFFILPIIHCSCPDGFELVAAGECRMLNPFNMSLRGDQVIDTAINQCSRFQAHPVTIHNDEQQTYWTVQRNLSSNWFILELVCNRNTLQWQWSDGSAVDYKPPPSAGYNAALDNDCYSGCVWMIYNSNGFWGRFCDQLSYQTDIYCASKLQQPIPSGDGCEEFEDDKDDRMCYQVGKNASNWKEAQIVCGSFGGQVASIHNDKENAFLRRIAVSKGAVTGMFLGASYSGKNNEFLWNDGSSWNYDNFYPVKGLGDCLMMDTSGTSGNWANIDCSSTMSVACERQQGYLAPACQQGPFVEGQIIYTPGFPFDASTPCDIILNVDPGKKLELEVLLLEVNTCCDELIIYENYFGGTIIANLTGQVIDKKFTTSSSNFMRVSWQPNGGVNVKGVMFTYKAV